MKLLKVALAKSTLPVSKFQILVVLMKKISGLDVPVVLTFQ